jgi:hypothetical protein
MPQYFFSLRFEGSTLDHADGLQCADADEAWERAKALAQHVMQSDFDRVPDWLRCSVVVKDEAGEVVLEMPFTEAVETAPPKS